MLPVVGEPADGINAIWYYVEGDKTNAALSAGSLISFLGWGGFAAKHGDEAL